MLPKPPGCFGCPYFGNGQGFVPDRIQAGASVHIMAQNPGADEEVGRRFIGWVGREKRYVSHPPEPLLGVTGYDLERRYLPLAGLSRDAVSLSNAIRCRVNDENELPPIKNKTLRAAIQHCQRAHFVPQADTSAYVALGEPALYALTGRTKIKQWRGWALPYEPIAETDGDGTAPMDIYQPPTQGLKGVLAMYHPAFVYRAPWEQPVIQLDWIKLHRFLKGTWPKPLPPIETTPPKAWPMSGAFDTEFNPDTGTWFCYSLAYRDKNGLARLHVVDNPKRFSGYLCSSMTHVVMHNAAADIPYLDQILPFHGYRIDDTMYKHAALWPDLDHDLGFLGSLYSSLNRWKHLEYLNPIVYAAADAWSTLEIDAALNKELAFDSRVKSLYETHRLPLIPLIMKAESRPIKVHQDNVRAALKSIDQQRHEAQALAQAAVGWPMNIGSPLQVKEALYGQK